MSQQPDGADLRRQIDELARRLTAGEGTIAALGLRADAAEARAESTSSRADKADRRADDTEQRADANDVRVDGIEARAAIDREIIAELQAGGEVRREHVEHLKTALQSSRTIGAAIGIIMGSRHVNEADAFAILQKVSQDSNRKLSAIAADLVKSSVLPQ